MKCLQAKPIHYSLDQSSFTEIENLILYVFSRITIIKLLFGVICQVVGVYCYSGSGEYLPEVLVALVGSLWSDLAGCVG